MKTLFALAATAFCLVIIGCASTGALREIAYDQRDLPERSAIEIRFRNQSEAQMCVLPEHWPNSAGAISDADKRAFLVVGTQRFPMRSFNAGYCLNGCATPIKPREELVALIPYKFFDLPSDLADQQKRLEFTSMAYPCRGSAR